MGESYSIYAVRYAHLVRRSADNFVGGDPHDVAMPLDYFVWAIVGTNAVYIVDTGFEEASARRRSRKIVTPVAEGLKAVGIDLDAVSDVILTHLHYDHAGNHEIFPAARYHVQDREMAFCTGRHMCHGFLAHHYDPADVEHIVRKLFEGRVVFHDGASEIAPGISVHHLGGHTDGLQCVRVRTERGWVVLASDAAHFYANIERATPFPAVFNAGDVLEGFGTLKRLATSNSHVVPGHDPQVLTRYPAAMAGTENWIVRVDLPPVQSCPSNPELP